MPEYTLFLGILCTVVMVVLFFAVDSFFSLPVSSLHKDAGEMAVTLTVCLLPQLTYSIDLNVRSCVAIWPQDTENHGLTLEVRGTKDAGTSQL